MADWDAARYHRISDPQLAWGRVVVARLAPVAGERILDVGCGTGRLTEEIAGVPGVAVVGLDASAAMLAEASRRARPRDQPPVGELHTLPAYVQGDGSALPFTAAFDAVFSNATFHWVSDHDRLFQSVHAALKPGGRLVAQCGGAGNLRQLYGRARLLMADPRYASSYIGWTDPVRFEGIEATERRLQAAGFADIEVTLVPAPTEFDAPEKFAEFIASVCLRHELARLPPGLRDPFIDELTIVAAADEAPLTLDYWRLNIAARKRAS
jgi:trans-aconitate 2-methyltransferase